MVLSRPALRDPNKTDMNDAAKAILFMVDLLLEEDETVAITGVEVIMDASSMTFQHAAQMNPSLIKKASTIMQVLSRSGDEGGGHGHALVNIFFGSSFSSFPPSLFPFGRGKGGGGGGESPLLPIELQD